MARWNGLKILIPKHMWKSKIGLLEQIWGQNPYDAFFLGHPVQSCTYMRAISSIPPVVSKIFLSKYSTNQTTKVSLICVKDCLFISFKTRELFSLFHFFSLLFCRLLGRSKNLMGPQFQIFPLGWIPEKLVRPQFQPGIDQVLPWKSLLRSLLSSAGLLAEHYTIGAREIGKFDRRLLKCL